MNITDLECPYCNINPFLKNDFTCECGYHFESWTDFLTIFSTRIRHLQEEIENEQGEEYYNYVLIKELKQQIKYCSKVIQYLKDAHTKTVGYGKGIET